VLAQAFLETLCARYQQPQRRLHPEALAALREHSWPGNVRELENLIHREFLVADDLVLALSALPRSASAVAHCRIGTGRGGDSAPSAASTRPEAASQKFREAKARVIAQFEKEYVCDLLQKVGGNVSLAARLAGKERSRFNRLVRKYDIDAREFRSAGSSARSG
jgi:DNA-binding NtrC family response regulator